MKTARERAQESVHYVLEILRPDIDSDWTSSGSPHLSDRDAAMRYMAMVRKALPKTVKLRLVMVEHTVFLET